MQLSAFDFVLPDELIALSPLGQRDASRLLHVDAQGLPSDKVFQDIVALFEAGDVIVLNNSKVLPAALSGLRRRGEYEAQVHFNLHKRCSDHQWFAFAKPLKRLSEGDRLRFGGTNQSCLMGALDATVEQILEGGEVLLSFDVSGPALDDQLQIVGDMPLPPYIAGRRAPTESDRARYQTVYAKDDGSVAAPTAGFHFTNELLDRLRAKGVVVEFVTLHVGAGTFLPVKTELIDEHKMHAEWGQVDESVVSSINKTRAQGRRVTAVGTTSLRLLETAARASRGLKASDEGPQASCEVVKPWQGETDIFIKPGFEFQVVDRLITNFHLPKSTLFMLVSAFSGLDVMQRAYAHAIEQRYRFYSYGDACFLERHAS